MTRVLVTGGTGELGGHVADRLDDQGYTVRIMSRQPSRLPADSDREWAQADIGAGEGLADAVEGVDTIVHAASDPYNSEAVDVEGTKQLLEHAETAAVERILYVSIVGIDAWESGWFPYYRHKLAAEDVVAASDLDWTIQRATQFHSLLDGAFRALRWAPVWPLPTDWRVQPVAAREVATHVAGLVEEQATGRVPDIGGPQTHTVGDLARTWQDVTDTWRPTVRLPVPGTISGRVREGTMAAEDGQHGDETWTEWLQRTTSG